jgi:uncharacterized membrane protein YdjX (TVP38/TMEM64 family)
MGWNAMKKEHVTFGLAIFLAVLAATSYLFGFSDTISLDNILAGQAFFQDLCGQRNFLSLAVFFSLIFLFSSLSFPGLILLILAGGSLFGFWVTLVIVSFADSIGSTIAFLFSRYFFGNQFQAKYADHLTVINEGIRCEGAFFLFSMRMMPFFPVFSLTY